MEFDICLYAMSVQEMQVFMGVFEKIAVPAMGIYTMFLGRPFWHVVQVAVERKTIEF